MTEVETAWAAGLFEGEGSIVCHKIINRANSYRVTLTMTMVDRDVVERFYHIVGVGSFLGPYKGQRDGNQEKYVWQVQNFSGCLLILEKFLPYLGARRKEKAIETIALCKERLDIKD